MSRFHRRRDFCLATPVRALMLTGALTVFALVALVSMARAQEADVVQWSFAPRGIFADQRVVTAFVGLVAAPAVSAAHPGAATLEYAAPDDFLPEATPEDAPLLLMAAGVVDADGSVQLREARPCAIWTPHDDAGEAISADVAAALGVEFARVFGTLGLDITPCEVTNDPAAADILLWSAAEDAEPAASEGDSFLVFPTPAGPADPAHGGDGNNGASPPADGAGGGPAPAAAGHGPAALAEQAHPSVLDVVAVLVALLLAIAVARGSTGRRRAS